MGSEAAALKRSSASLTGGLFVGVAVFIIAGLVLTELDLGSSLLEWVVAAVVAFAFGGYVRLADL